jgi:hypothetical protein
MKKNRRQIPAGLTRRRRGISSFAPAFLDRRFSFFIIHPS